jgi:hypothetical protein
MGGSLAFGSAAKEACDTNQVKPLSLVSAHDALRPACLDSCDELVTHSGEEATRQNAVTNVAVSIARNRAEIRTRPNEFVPFGKYDPRPIRIETQSFLYAQWNFDGRSASGRRCVRDRKDQYARFTIVAATYRGNH